MYIAGITPQPHGRWIKQIARNVTDPINGFLLGTRYLIMDRDKIFTAEFRRFLKQEDVKAVRLPARSPNLKDYVAYCTSSVWSGTNSVSRRRSNNFAPRRLTGALASTGS